MTLSTLSLGDFARLFGTGKDDFDSRTRAFINNHDFTYNELSLQRRDEIILEVLKRTDSGEFTAAGRDGLSRWEKGWGESLKGFIDKGYDPRALTPKYVRPNQPLRLDRRYIMPHHPDLELNFFTVLRLWLFNKYLRDSGAIYEFGCGSGYNLFLMAELFPGRKIFGLDWSGASVEITNLMGQKINKDIQGRLFDMFSPDYALEIPRDSAAVTIGGLEQLGGDYQAMLQFLCAKAPGICVHVEPFLELYDENNLLDYLAARFHRRRNYLNGFLNDIRALQLEGKVEIIKLQRVFFGSLFHDGWSLLVWRVRA